jgi:hypothetical protein
MAGTDKLQVIQNRAVGSRQLTRREMVGRMLAGVGAGAAWPLVAASHPIYEHLVNGEVFDEAEKLGAADWKPLFLTPQQDEMLAALAEKIVPGSTKALVNRFIDLLLSVDTGKHKKSFTDALAAFEGESQKRFGKGFPSLDSGQQNELLSDACVRPAQKESPGSDEKEQAGLHEDFENLQGWIGGAYYSSEAGMRELGWTGDYAFEKFPGCEHPEEHS